MEEPTRYNRGKFYKELNKSSLTPPGYVFGIAWTILYIILAIYFVMALLLRGTEKALVYFAIQMVINFSWTYVFFTKNYQRLALIMIILMIIFSVLSMIEMLKINKNVAYLLIPYIVWLCFATYLNSYIILKN